MDEFDLKTFPLSGEWIYVYTVKGVSLISTNSTDEFLIPAGFFALSRSQIQRYFTNNYLTFKVDKNDSYFTCFSYDFVINSVQPLSDTTTAVIAMDTSKIVNELVKSSVFQESSSNSLIEIKGDISNLSTQIINVIDYLDNIQWLLVQKAGEVSLQTVSLASVGSSSAPLSIQEPYHFDMKTIYLSKYASIRSDKRNIYFDLSPIWNDISQFVSYDESTKKVTLNEGFEFYIPVFFDFLNTSVGKFYKIATYNGSEYAEGFFPNGLLLPDGRYLKHDVTTIDFSTSHMGINLFDGYAKYFSKAILRGITCLSTYSVAEVPANYKPVIEFRGSYALTYNPLYIGVS